MFPILLSGNGNETVCFNFMSKINGSKCSICPFELKYLQVAGAALLNNPFDKSF